jgi:energy-converting hydrogenase Eha subunit E
MSVAIVSRTARKSRNTAASLIATEFATRQENPLEKSSKQEVAAPAPTAETHAANPAILALITFVAVTVLVKALIALILIAAKITKKITTQVAAFWAAQVGGEKIDFRVYQAIFD